MDKTQLIIQKNIEKGRTGLKRLEEASKNGFEENRKLLLKIIEENKNTQYGKKYGFEYIKTIEDYIKKVPVTEYKDYEEYIAGIERGEKNVLSARETIHFALSSGSSGTPKKVPMCQEAADLFAMYTHGACFAAMDRSLETTGKRVGACHLQRYGSVQDKTDLPMALYRARSVRKTRRMKAIFIHRP